MTHSTSSREPAWTSSHLERNPHAVEDKDVRVRDMFSAIAGAYDTNNRLHSFGRDQAWRRRAVRLAEVKPTDDVLDVACGTGDLTEAFRLAGPRSIVGLDFTPAMLEIARRKSSRPSHVEPTPKYVEGDAQALLYDDASFDIVSIAFGIRNVSSPEQAFREFRRVLRPGGRLVVLEFDEPRFTPFRWCHHIYTHYIMPFTATIIARDRSGAYRYLPRSVETFMTGEVMRSTLERGGFRVATQCRMTMGTVTITVATPENDGY